MSKQITAIILLVAMLLAAVSACSKEPTSQTEQSVLNPFTSFRDIPGVTEQEIADIEALQKEREFLSYGMVLSIEAFIKNDGEIGGYSAFVSEWLTGLFDIPFQVEIHPMNLIIEKLDAFEVDFSGVMMINDVHLARYFMTDVIAERQFVTLRLADGPKLNEIERTLRYAFIENAPSESAVAAVTAPGSYEPVWVSNAMEGYQAVIDGEADAFIMSKNNDALFAANTDVIIEDFFPLIFNPVAIATANPALESIISVITKAQQNGADAYLNYMYSLAYQEYQRHKMSVRLTDEERSFIAAAGKIPVGAKGTNYPLSFYHERSDQWQGIFFDILDEVTTLTGLEFEVVNDKTARWSDMHDLLISGKAAIAPQIEWVTENDEIFKQSSVVLYRDDFALISHSDYHNIVLNDISSELVGLIRGTIYAETFNQWFPNHRNIVMYETQDLAFEGLKQGEVNLVMSTSGRLMQLTHYQELPDFKANYIFDDFTEVRFGFNNNQTDLMSIIDKALILINTDSIVNQWTGRTYDYRTKAAEEQIPLLVGISVLSVLIVALLLLMFFRSRNLIKQKTKENEQSKLQLVKIELMAKAAHVALWDVEIKREDSVDPESVFVWSDEFRQMLGYENEEDFPNVLASLKNVMHPDYLERTDKAFTDHVLDKTGNTPFDVEYRLMKKNGEYSYFRACGEAIRDDDGNAIHIAGALMDISEMKTEQERMMLMLDTSPQIIGIWDAHYNIIDCNKSTVDLLGLTNKQEYKDRFYTDCHPEYQPDGLHSGEKATAQLRDAFENGQSIFEWTLKKPHDGTLIPTEVTLVRAKFDDKDVVIGYTRDLREQKEQLALLERMRDADERMRTLLAINPQVNFLFDSNFKVIDCNPAATELMGFKTREETIAGFAERLIKSTPEFQPDGRRSISLAEWITRTVKEGQVKFETELDIQGIKRVLDVELKKIPHKDSFAIVGFVHELTELKNLIHEAERQRGVAETANKTKSEFLSHMSHEIRTPMNAIMGTAEFQLQSENTSPETEEAFDMIYNSGNLLLNIINDILDLSKIEAGKLEIMRERYDIPSIIYDTVQLILLRFDSKQIEFDLEIDESTPLEMFGDELRIKQVMNNLLSNAFKYTDKGKVVLSVSAEDSDGPTAPNSSADMVLVLSVKDTGQGMTEDQIHKLFEEYTRFNMDTNRTIVGTGLGMHITKRLIDAMDGEIHVKSEIGKGSEFIVRLPQEQIGDKKCGADLASQLRNTRFMGALKTSRAQVMREYMPYGKVLIVDDVESNLYVARGLMMPYGLDIETVTSGFAAIDKVEAGKKYDIIFMDHMMPVMNGIDSTEKIRKMGYTDPIIALTANAVVGSSAMYLENGFDGFMSKPIDMRELNSILNRLIRDKQPPEVIEAAQRQVKQKPINGATLSGHKKSEFSKIVVQDIEKALVVLEEMLPRLNKMSVEETNLFVTTVHGMKSALLNTGEKELSDKALSLEQAGEAGSIAELTANTPLFMKALKTVIEKHSPEDTDENAFISDENKTFLMEGLSKIKTASESIQKRAAKASLGELKAKSWPRTVNELLDDISVSLLHGEFKKVISDVDKFIENQTD